MLNILLFFVGLLNITLLATPYGDWVQAVAAAVCFGVSIRGFRLDLRHRKSMQQVSETLKNNNRHSERI